MYCAKFAELLRWEIGHLLCFSPLGRRVINWMLTVEFCFVRIVVGHQEPVSCEATSAHFTKYERLSEGFIPCENYP